MGGKLESPSMPLARFLLLPFEIPPEPASSTATALNARGGRLASAAMTS